MNDISNPIKVLEELSKIESNPNRGFTNCGPYLRKMAKRIEEQTKNEGLGGMYRNNEKRIILKDVNFLVYLDDENDIQAVLKEIEESGDYDGEDVYLSPRPPAPEYLAKKKNGEWVIEQKEKPMFCT